MNNSNHICRFNRLGCRQQPITPQVSLSILDFQRAIDEDKIGDACDPDTDGDGIPDVQDLCPYLPYDESNDMEGKDRDGDGVGDMCDNCIDMLVIDHLISYELYELSLCL